MIQLLEWLGYLVSVFIFVIVCYAVITKIDQSYEVIETCLFIEPLQIDGQINDERLSVVWNAGSDSTVGYKLYAQQVTPDSIDGWISVKRIFLGSRRVNELSEGSDGYENRFIVDPGAYRISIEQIFERGTTHVSTSKIIGMATESTLTIDRSQTNGPVNLTVTVPYSQNVKLTLFNLLGQDLAIIFDNGIDNVKTIPIDLSSFTAGVYFILLEAGQDHKTVKINYAK